VSATTAAVEAAGMAFRNLNDLMANRAVYQDFTNQFLISKGLDIEPRTAADAAAILASIVSSHRFTLYEYFTTDKVGHAQDFSAAKTVLANLSELIRELLRRLDLTRTTVLLTSDHGNIEDLSTRNHTLNDVPTIVWGRNRDRIAGRIRDLADITPVIVDTLLARTTA
jgi:bisphosphoglycerate-independent phosphoglycerate mutase (AlkP superfamily)